MILEHIASPEDVKKLSRAQLPVLCGELRQFLVDSVSRTGGHLASNLGTVELTVAIHRVFDTARDRLVFDVGHQCYVHKALTGRRELFSTLRQFGGNARMDKGGFAGGDIRPLTGIQVGARGIGRTVYGQTGVLIEFFNVYFHRFHKKSIRLFCRFVNRFPFENDGRAPHFAERGRRNRLPFVNEYYT